MTDAASPFTERPRLRGGHILTILVAFFLVVVAVDGYMIFKAISTFGGIETPDAYRKGVAYNESIAKDVQQSALGWNDAMGVSGTPRRLDVELRDKAGAPIAGRRLVATLGRPATDRFDLTLPLNETSPGRYEAALAGVSEGTWIIDLSAYDAGIPGEPVYQARRRLWIGP